MNLEPIDTSTTAGKAEVMRLAAEGRGLAYKNRFNKKWERHVQPEICDWDWRTASFAIIAEPDFPDEVWIQQRDGALWAYPQDREGSVRYVRADE